MTTERMRVPDAVILHDAHHVDRPSGYDSKPTRLLCSGKTYVSGCPVTEDRERAYLAGHADGVHSTSGYDVNTIGPIRTGPKPKPEPEDDPHPGPTGNGTEDFRRLEAWYQRHPDDGAKSDGSKSPPLRESLSWRLDSYTRHRDNCATIRSGRDGADLRCDCGLDDLLYAEIGRLEKATGDRPHPESGTSPPDSEPLRDWWVRTATEDIDRTMPKIREYGALDLELIGYALARMLGREVSNRGELERLGIWFYELGKVARAISAIGAGGLPSSDTALDTAFYAMMDRRINGSGGWP